MTKEKRRLSLITGLSGAALVVGFFLFTLSSAQAKYPPDPGNAPYPPANFTAVGPSSTDKVVLKWDKVTGDDFHANPTGYVIYLKYKFPQGGVGETYGYDHVVAVINDPNVTSFTHAGLAPSTYYFYYIAARSNGLEGSDNATGGSTVAAPSSSVPSGKITLVGTALSSTEISLNWNKADGADSYNIYRNDNLLFPNFRKIANVPSGFIIFNYIDKGLSPGTQYSYYVAPYALTSGEGNQSNIPYITTLNVATSTPTSTSPGPRNLTATSSYYYNYDGTIVGKVTLNWDPTPTSYAGIFRSSDGVNFSRISNILTGPGYFVDKGWLIAGGLKPGNSYWYKVTGHNGSTESETGFSNAVRVDIPPYTGIKVPQLEYITLTPATPTSTTVRVFLSYFPTSTADVKLYRSLDGINYSYINLPNQPQPYYAGNYMKVDANVLPATTYYYKATLVQGGRESDFSDAAYAATTTQAAGVMAPREEESLRVRSIPTRSSSSDVSMLTESNSASTIEFMKTPDAVVKPGAVVSVKYGYTNDGDKTQYVRLTRELVNESGKLAAPRVSSFRTISAGKDITVNARQLLSRRLREGIYTMRVRVTNRRTGEVIEENSFSFTVQR